MRLLILACLLALASAHHMCGVDLVFVMDASGSVDQTEFNTMVDFVYNTVDGLEIDEGTGDGARVGVVVYHTYVQFSFGLDDYQDKDDLLDAIRDLESLIRTDIYTNTHLAISFAQTNIFDPNGGDRPNAPNVMVVLTDGYSGDPTATQDEATAAKTAGTRILAVGIGTGLTNVEINGIASSPPEDVLEPGGFDELDQLVDDLTEALCGNECEFIDPYTEKCCCGDIQAGNETSCCGEEGFDAATEICCDGEVFEVGDASDYTCCEYAPMHISNDLCCDGVVHPAAGRECCGTNSFDTYTEVCCEGNVQSGDCCCGAVGFDSATQHCCNGQVVSWGANYDCCGTVPYDQENEVCCGSGNVVPKVQYNRCNGVRYRPRREMCCCDQINDEREDKWQCCGTVSYRMKYDLCCEGNVLIPGYPADTYDCCGTLPYDPTQDSCCDGQIHPGVKIAGVTACCGDKLYTIGDQLCCDGYVYDASPSYITRCCGSIIFYPEFEVCCAGVVHPGASLLCCGSDAYDPAVESCCPDGSIQPSN